MKRVKWQKPLIISLSTLCLVASQVLAGPTVSVDFLGRISGNTANQAILNQPDVAGVVPVGNWNAVDDYNLTATPENGTAGSFLDDTANASPVTLTFAAQDSWFNDTPTAAITNANSIMMQGIIKANGPAGTKATFNFNNVPEGQYDLYVYTSMNGDNVTCNVSDWDDLTTYYITEVHQFYDTNTFVRGTNTDPNGFRDTCSYVKLSNLGTYGRGEIGAVVTRVAGADGAGVSGLQLVNIGPALPSVAPAFLHSPTNTTVNEGASASFATQYGTDFTGTPTFYVQWNKNGAPIQGATNRTLTLSPLWFTDNGDQISVTISNNVGKATSSAGTITVVQDFTKPTLVSATGSDDFKHVVVVFSKPLLQSTAETTGNYTLDNGLTVSSATLTSPNTVTLTTSAQTPGGTYNLTVNNVKDQTTAGNTIAANSVIPMIADVIATGIVHAFYWNNINGTAVSALTSDPRYSNNVYDVSAYHVGLNASESYINGKDIENYGGKVIGWIIPPTNGNYNFFLRSDDASQLFLSTDDTAANLSAAPIAEETGCCKAFLEPGAPQTTAAPITLVGGQKYYFMALLKEGGGGDYVQVAMRQDTDTTPAANLKPISGANVAAAVSPVGATVAITAQPTDTTAEAGEPVTFTVGATGSSVIGTTVLYQWQRNGTAIAGATASKYTIATPAIAGDNGAQFSVVVSVPGKSITSSTATLTVVPDTFPLQVSVTTIKASDGSDQIGVSFDEPADLTTLVPANFTLTGGTITSFKVATNSFLTYGSVILTATGLTPGHTNTLSVKNVKDPQGNVTSTNVSFTLGEFSWAETGTQITPGQVVPVGTNGFDILNGGRQEWGSYDEIDMAYLIKTNDFDVKVEVIYAEPGSEWTRVGLQARNALNVGEPNSDRTNTTSEASAYAQTHVNPSQTLGSSGAWDPNDPVQPGNNTPNNGHEQNQRLTKGGATSGWGNAGAGGVPQYPTAWLRLARQGTNLHGYSSADGVNWVDQGTTSLTDQQNYMYVGPFLGVETGNIFSGTPPTGFDVWGSPFDPHYDRLFVAKFRNFSDVVAVTQPTISISKSGTAISIVYTGTLLQSTNLGASATWTPVTAATSPYVVPTTSSATFFRSK